MVNDIYDKIAELTTAYDEMRMAHKRYLASVTELKKKADKLSCSIEFFISRPTVDIEDYEIDG